MRERIGNLSRRELLKLFGVTVGATMANSAVWPLKVQAQSKKVTPRNNVRNVLVIQNCGAMSPQECLDFKDTRYTAKDLDIQRINSEFSISKTIFPNYEKWAPRATLVRSMYENSLVHFSAQYHTQAGRALNAAILREIPALGSIVAMELDSQRRESDTFPTFMSFDLWNARCPQIGSGMLPARFAGLDINTANVFSSFGGEGDSETNSVLAKRWEGLGRLSEVSPVGKEPIGGKADEYPAHYEYAFKILMDARFKKVLTLSEQDKARYGVPKDTGAAKIGLAMLLARNVLAADAGARFLWVTNSYNGGNGSFDNHVGLYGRGAAAPKGAQLSIYDSGPRFDAALSSFVEDLSRTPGKAPGKTMLDETMIVLLHEFGRTADMNPAGGRDHWGKAFTNLFLGGGIKPGRVIGKTDETGAAVVNVGWDHKEQPMMDHVTSTIYSSLGIDYSKKITNTPSGRAYEYQQTAPLGGPAFIPQTEIAELFE
jgi:Protein of unknown function (DUF1501)